MFLNYILVSTMKDDIDFLQLSPFFHGVCLLGGPNSHCHQLCEKSDLAPLSNHSEGRRRRSSSPKLILPGISKSHDVVRDVELAMDAT